MTTDKILAIGSDSIQRAELHSEGDWRVTSHLAGYRPATVAHNVHQPAVIWAGTNGHGVFRSIDCGRTWDSYGLDGLNVKSIAISPHDPATIYAGVKPAGVYKSTDGGITWYELDGFRQIPRRWWWFSPAEKPYQAYVMALSVSPADPDVVLAGIEFGAVVRSEDGGRTWSGHRKGAIRDCHGLKFHHTHGDWVYQAGASLVGAAVSRDGGLSWQQPKEGLDRRYGWTCAADPERPEIWYLSAGPIGWSGIPQAHKDGQADAAIYRKAGGAPWERLAGGLPEPMTHLAYALVTVPAAPGRLYAGLSNGEVWHSADYGDTWHQAPFNLGRISHSMVLIQNA